MRSPVPATIGLLLWVCCLMAGGWAAASQGPGSRASAAASSLVISAPAIAAKQPPAPSHLAATLEHAVAAPAFPISSDGLSISSPELALAPRSISDWKLTNLVLVSTVDGSLQARDRRTGVVLWTLPGKPLIEVEQLMNDKEHMDLETIWIAEPTADGALFYFSATTGLERIPASIKDLIEKAPFALLENVVYTGSKSTTLYSIDAATGALLRSYGGPSSVIGKAQCEAPPQDSPLPMEGGTLLIGRTDMILEIHEKITARAWKVRFSYWAPNSRDIDLERQYTRPLDSLYVTPIHNTTVIAMAENDYRPQRWVGQVASTAVKVFDVLTPANSDGSGHSPLVLMPQPPLHLQGYSDGRTDLYVDRTPKGDFYALSGSEFTALVTSSASAPWCLGAKRVFRSPDELANLIVGVHPGWCQQTAPTPAIEKPLGISPPHGPSGIDGGLPPHGPQTPPGGLLLPGPPSTWKHFTTRILENVLTVIVVALLVVIAAQQGWLPGVIEALELLARRRNLASASASTASSASDGSASSSTSAKVDVESPELKAPVEPLDDEEPKPRSLSTSSSHNSLTTIASTSATSLPSSVDPPRRRKRGTRGGRKLREAKERAEREKPEDDDDSPRSDMSGSGSAMAAIGIPQDLVHSPIAITGEFLGSGSHGTTVWKGTFENREVAVKSMVLSCYDFSSQEVTLLQESDDHPNVIRYYCKYQTDKFLLIALELCPASLDEVLQGKTVRPTVTGQELVGLQQQLDPLDSLRQIASGLNHLHSLKIVHRDIKPQNILVASPKTVQIKGKNKTKQQVLQPLRLLISDFGLCKKLEGEQSSFQATHTSAAGTAGWTAPEIALGSRFRANGSKIDTSAVIVPEQLGAQAYRLTRAVDIFSLGCVFYYVLSPCCHPFGANHLRQMNIEKGEYNLDALAALPYGVEAHELISKMISYDPNQRPDTAEILRHPLFWSDELKLDFLVSISDRLEHESREEHSDLIDRLETRAPRVVGDDWHQRLPPLFVENLGKYRKYHGDRILDLLRALRNKFHHYNEYSPELKECVGSLPSGYLHFFTSRFPRLFIEVWEYGQQEFGNEKHFAKYFN